MEANGTLVKASRRTFVASAASSGLAYCLAALKRTFAAWSRFFISRDSVRVWTKLKVFVKRSCASSLLRISKAFPTASISS